ncbi:MAG: hypothetical protein WC932_02675 [archaeon]
MVNEYESTAVRDASGAITGYRSAITGAITPMGASQLPTSAPTPDSGLAASARQAAVTFAYGNPTVSDLNILRESGVYGSAEQAAVSRYVNKTATNADVDLLTQKGYLGSSEVTKTNIPAPVQTPAAPQTYQSPAAQIAAQQERLGGYVDPNLLKVARSEGYIGSVSTPAPGSSNLGSVMPLVDKVAAAQGLPMSIPSSQFEGSKTVTAYVPLGNYKATELENAKIALQQTTGEAAFYQKPYGSSYYKLIGGGGVGALQSGMFTVGKPETPAVYTQESAGKTFAPSANVPEAMKLLAHPELYSRAGAEVYGGNVTPLTGATVESTGARLSTYANPLNLANYVNPQGVNLPKSEMPLANAPYKVSAESPAIMTMGPSGITGAINIPESAKVSSAKPDTSMLGGLYVVPGSARMVETPTVTPTSGLHSVNISRVGGGFGAMAAEMPGVQLGMGTLTPSGFKQEGGAAYTPVVISPSGAAVPIAQTVTPATQISTSVVPTITPKGVTGPGTLGGLYVVPGSASIISQGNGLAAVPGSYKLESVTTKSEPSDINFLSNIGTNLLAEVGLAPKGTAGFGSTTTKESYAINLPSPYVSQAPTGYKPTPQTYTLSSERTTIEPSVYESVQKNISNLLPSLSSETQMDIGKKTDVLSQISDTSLGVYSELQQHPLDIAKIASESYLTGAALGYGENLLRMGVTKAAESGIPAIAKLGEYSSAPLISGIGNIAKVGVGTAILGESALNIYNQPTAFARGGEIAKTSTMLGGFGLGYGGITPIQTESYYKGEGLLAKTPTEIFPYKVSIGRATIVPSSGDVLPVSKYTTLGISKTSGASGQIERVSTIFGGLKTSPEGTRLFLGSPKVSSEEFRFAPDTFGKISTFAPKTPLETYMVSSLAGIEKPKIELGLDIRATTSGSKLQLHEVTPAVRDVVETYNIPNSGKVANSIVATLKDYKARLYGSSVQRGVGKEIGYPTLGRPANDLDIMLPSGEKGKLQSVDFAKDVTNSINRAAGKNVASVDINGNLATVKIGNSKLFDIHNENPSPEELMAQGANIASPISTKYTGLGMRIEPSVMTKEGVPVISFSEQVGRKLVGPIEYTPDVKSVTSKAYAGSDIQPFTVSGRLVPRFEGRVKDIPDYYFGERANIETLKKSESASTRNKANVAENKLNAWLETWGPETSKSVRAAYQTRFEGTSPISINLGEYQPTPSPILRSMGLGSILTPSPALNLIPSYSVGVQKIKSVETPSQKITSLSVGKMSTTSGRVSAASLSKFSQIKPTPKSLSYLSASESKLEVKSLSIPSKSISVSSEVSKMVSMPSATTPSESTPPSKPSPSTPSEPSPSISLIPSISLPAFGSLSVIPASPASIPPSTVSPRYGFPPPYSPPIESPESGKIPSALLFGGALSSGAGGGGFDRRFRKHKQVFTYPFTPYEAATATAKALKAGSNIVFGQKSSLPTFGIASPKPKVAVKQSTQRPAKVPQKPTAPRAAPKVSLPKFNMSTQQRPAKAAPRVAIKVSTPQFAQFKMPAGLTHKSTSNTGLKSISLPSSLPLKKKGKGKK